MRLHLVGFVSPFMDVLEYSHAAFWFHFVSRTHVHVVILTSLSLGLR